MSVDTLIEGLAEELELNEQSVALLRDIAGRLPVDDLEKVAQGLAAGERARHKKGWTEVFSGDMTGRPGDLVGGAKALELMAGKLSGAGRLVFVLYAKGPKGAKPQ